MYRSESRSGRPPMVDFAAQAGELVGLELGDIHPDESANTARYPGFTAATIDGKKCVALHRSQFDVSEPTVDTLMPHDGYHTNDPNRRSLDLRGMLGMEVAHLEVGVVPSAYNPLALRYREWFQIKTYLSPDDINDVQRELGLTPGHDSFAVKSAGVVGWIQPGIYVPAFGRMEEPVTELGSSYDIDHDLNPYDHIGTWIMTAGSICTAIARECRRVSEPYSDSQLSDPSWEAPASLWALTDALDIWANKHVNPIHHLVSAVEFPLDAGYEQSALVRLFNEINFTPKTKAAYSAEAASIKRLQTLGLIPEGADGRMKRAAADWVKWSLVHHIANMKLVLEEVKPRGDDSARRATVRKNTWNSLVKKAEEKLEIS